MQSSHGTPIVTSLIFKDDECDEPCEVSSAAVPCGNAVDAGARDAEQTPMMVDALDPEQAAAHKEESLAQKLSPTSTAEADKNQKDDQGNNSDTCQLDTQSAACTASQSSTLAEESNSSVPASDENLAVCERKADMNSNSKLEGPSNQGSNTDALALQEAASTSTDVIAISEEKCEDSPARVQSVIAPQPESNPVNIESKRVDVHVTSRTSVEFSDDSQDSEEMGSSKISLPALLTSEVRSRPSLKRKHVTGEREP